MRRAAVFGSGSWGTAYAAMLADAGNEVRMWGRRAELVAQVNEQHVNADYLPELRAADGDHGHHGPGRGRQRRRDRRARRAVADAAGQPGGLVPACCRRTPWSCR